jgi:hypothetical protein
MSRTKDYTHELSLLDDIWTMCRDYVGGGRKCSKHGGRHRPVPPKHIFDEVIELRKEVKLPVSVIAEHWKTSREAIHRWATRYYGENPFHDRQPRIDWEGVLATLLEEVRLNPKYKTQRDLENLSGIPSIRTGMYNHKDNPLVDAIKEQLAENQKVAPATIKCYRCHEEKDTKTEFHNSLQFKDGYSRTCKDCSKATQKKYYYKRVEANKDGEVFVEEKWCSWCKQTKSRDSFHRAKGNTTGLQQYCKPCQDMLQKRSISRRNIDQNTWKEVR